MSNSPNFFVQGKIDTHSDVYIVAKTTITSRNGSITPADVFQGQVTGQDTMWSILGAQQQYTPYEDLKDNVYYHYTSGSYYYPLKVYSHGEYTTEFKLNNSGTVAPTAPTMTLYTNVENLGGVATPPPFSDGYINCESLFELPLIVTSENRYHFPLFFNSNTASHNTATTTLERFFYFSSTTLPDVTTLPANPAKLMLGNPYQTPMDNLFRIEQSTKENQGMSITLSSSIGNPSVTKFKNITMDDTTNILSCSDTGESSFFNFQPQDVNIDNVHLYAGVGYKLNLSESVSKTPKINIMGKIKKDSTIIKKAGIEYPETSTPSNTSFLINYDIPDKNYGTLKTLDNATTTLYFIPYHSMYQISTGGRLEYTGYDPIEMLLTSPQVFNVGPKIKTGSLASAGATNYFTWVDTVKISTSKTELAFATDSHTSSSKLVTRYCAAGEFCGKCQGTCSPPDGLETSMMCILDTESQSEFTKGDDYFTCDHERFLDSSDYSKRGPFANHSSSFIIIVIVAAVVIIAGFVLFEERKMILKHTLNLKNGHHHTH